MKKRLSVFWSGRVQGVGFRYTAESAALKLGVAGWVRNLPDGRVEAVVEGPEKTLKTLLDQIASGPMKKYIRGVETRWEKPTGEFDGFQIRFF